MCKLSINYFFGPFDDQRVIEDHIRFGILRVIVEISMCKFAGCGVYRKRFWNVKVDALDGILLALQMFEATVTMKRKRISFLFLS